MVMPYYNLVTGVNVVTEGGRRFTLSQEAQESIGLLSGLLLNVLYNEIPYFKQFGSSLLLRHQFSLALPFLKNFSKQWKKKKKQINQILELAVIPVFLLCFPSPPIQQRESKLAFSAYEQL